MLFSLFMTTYIIYEYIEYNTVVCRMRGINELCTKFEK